ncbi:MAG: DUF1007 family protein [Hyphomicrobium sp.]|nr:DUF1007 family protein [Hyphomicrobium sp.]
MVHMRAARARLAAAVLAGAAACMGSGPARAHPHVWVTTETTVLYENGTIVGLRQKWSFDDFYTSMAIQGLDTNNDGTYDRSELAELAKVNMDGLKEFEYFTAAKLGSEKLKFDAPKDFWLEHAEAPEGAVEVTMKTGDAAFEGTGAEIVKPPEPPKGMFARLWAWLFGSSASQPKTEAAAPPERPKVLSLHFTLPLAQPVLAEAPGFSFTIADPSFFIAFQPAEKDPVALGQGAPQGCRISIGDAPPEKTTPPTAEDVAKALKEPDPAADASRLGDAFTQQFGGQSVGFGFVRPATISCGPPS